jgi:hypothetical protein
VDGQSVEDVEPRRSRKGAGGGIRFAEGPTPLAIEVDERGAAQGLKVSLQRTDGDGGGRVTLTTLSARHLIAAGTQPNTC